MDVDKYFVDDMTSKQAYCRMGARYMYNYGEQNGHIRRMESEIEFDVLIVG